MDRGSQAFFLCGARTKPGKLGSFCIFVWYPLGLSCSRAELCIWKARAVLPSAARRAFAGQVLSCSWSKWLRSHLWPRGISLKSMGVLSILLQARQRRCLNSLRSVAAFPPAPVELFFSHPFKIHVIWASLDCVFSSLSVSVDLPRSVRHRKSRVNWKAGGTQTSAVTRCATAFLQVSCFQRKIIRYKYI